MELKEVNHSIVSKFFLDFQKKSKCYELPATEAEYIGIFEKDVLVGYFILQGYTDQSLDIIQGYLIPEARHKNGPKEAMRMLEYNVKKAGYTKIRILTNNRFRSYTQFMHSLGYATEKIVYGKEI